MDIYWITISYNPSSILKGIEATCVLKGIKWLFEKDVLYLGASVGAYNVSKFIGGNEEGIYPYLSDEGYIGKVMSVVE